MKKIDFIDIAYSPIINTINKQRIIIPTKKKFIIKGKRIIKNNNIIQN